MKFCTHYIACLFMSLSFVTSLVAQGDSCIEFEEFCPAPDGSDLFYPAGVDNGFAEPGNNYGCLQTTPNPAWYYLQIGADGNVTIQLSNTNNEDIDFALWGPFHDLDAAEASCGDLGSPTDCSYATWANETVNIPYSNVNDIYILLITNYSNDPTDIVAEATGDGVPFCCRVPINNGEVCDDPTEFSCGCWTTGITGTLPISNPQTPPPGFCGDTENSQWISFEACWCGVSIDVSAPDCASGEGVEAQLFSNCAPYEPVSDCITIAPGATETLPALSGGNTILCNLGQEYMLLLDGVNADSCDYIVTATEVPIDPPNFIQDTIYGPTTVCTFDTVVYQFPPVTQAASCTAYFTGSDGEVLDVSHDNITVVFGEESGDLCIQAFNCEGSTTFCMPIEVIECCFSEPGSLVQNDLVLCPDEPAVASHLGDSSIVDTDAGLYVLHDGSGSPLGTIMDQNDNGTFYFFDDLNFEQTYYIDYVVMGTTDDGQLDPDKCLLVGENTNTTRWRAAAPGLSASTEIYTCDELASSYTVEIALQNGTAYFVNGAALSGSTFVSQPIASGEGYSFEITDENFCLQAFIVSGSYECPCTTDAGSIDDTPAALCGSESVQVENIVPPTLDNDDVLVYELSTMDGDVLLTNSTGSFEYQPVLQYGEPYQICARAGNDTGNGPLDDYACASRSNCKEVVFYEEITVTLPVLVEILCNDPQPVLIPEIEGGSGDFDYLWTFDGNQEDDKTIMATTAGTYELSVSDKNSSCGTTATVQVTQAPVVEALQLDISDPICADGENGYILIDSVIGGVAPFRYRMDAMNFSNTQTQFSFLEAGNYEIAVLDANDCEYLVDVTLYNPPEPMLDLGPDQTIELGEVANIEAQTNLSDYTIRWYIDGALQPDSLARLDTMLLESSIIQAEIFDKNDCTTEDALRVTVSKENPIFVPNAFSPNGDGLNEKLTVFGNASVESILELRVFNRWGSLVYEASDFQPNDVSIGWDGFFRGKSAEPGVYVYSLSVRFIDGRTRVFGGDVALMR